MTRKASPARPPLPVPEGSSLYDLLKYLCRRIVDQRSRGRHVPNARGLSVARGRGHRPNKPGAAKLPPLFLHIGDTLLRLKRLNLEKSQVGDSTGIDYCRDFLMAFTSLLVGLKKMLGVGGSKNYPSLSPHARRTDIKSTIDNEPAIVKEKSYTRPPSTAPTTRVTGVSTSAFEGGKRAGSTSDISHAPKGELDGLTWFGLCSLRVAGADIELQDPIAYFHYGDLPPSIAEPAAVDLALSIASRSSTVVDDPPLPYWPKYQQLTPSQRRLYLDWLARGRRDIPTQVGYLFLFLYGLERRALLERRDIKLVFKEVLRLRQVYERCGQKVSSSFEGYTASLLWYLLLREPEVFEERHFDLLIQMVPLDDSERLALALSWLVRGARPLPAAIAFRIAEQLPRSQRSVVAKRVGDQLRDLFFKRFTEQFPDGLLLKSSKRDRKYFYRPANATLESCEISAPNPAGIMSQFNTLADLWNECITSLKRLSTLVAGNTAGDPMSVETWKAMPEDLRRDIDHPLTDAFASFIREKTGDSANTFVPARSLATLVGLAPEAKLTLAACRRVSECVAEVGYCMEPDPCALSRALDDDEKIVLFLNLGDGCAEPKRYLAASVLLEVGLTLAHVDGSAEDGELAMLTQHLDSVFELNEHEKRRLSNLRALRAAYPQDLSELTRPLKKLPSGERAQVARFAVALVASDGLVTKDEQKAVRKLYAALGFDRLEADRALAELLPNAPDSDEPVTVQGAVEGKPGEAIPQGTPVPPKPMLDREAIAAILKETHEVSRMLADAMSVEDQPTDPLVAVSISSLVVPQVIAAAPGEASDSDVPARYAAFYQAVITRGVWTRTDLADLAKRHDLMLSGALEAINEWATEKHGGPLLYEESEQISLETAYLN